ncbi:MAG: hypothetical protein KatS3mg053_3485 [Candidatus Roseilinea sp.]|nr:MAG: hypothetical protein KatS3mg053_3485 [Candidatus Roseilinea sp.]
MTFQRCSVLRIVVKALSLFVALNITFALVNVPANSGVAALGRISLYNVLWPGRARLPYGDDPARAYNLSLFDLNAMFASHELAGVPKRADEFRVLLIGDSATWGWLLHNEDTLAGQLNAMRLKTADGRIVRAYNLGYPIMSLTKDLLVLSRAVAYQPDLVVWLVTLESFPADKQLVHPIVQHNAEAVRALIAEHHLRSRPDDPALLAPTFLQRTLVGQRRALADWLRLQTYGALWAATRIDQHIPETYEPAQRDLDADRSFKGLLPPTLPKDALAFDVLDAGIRMAADAGAPMLIVNEPILISRGKNSDVRYNFFYPRWAYNRYRELMGKHLHPATVLGDVYYFDAWNLVPQEEFTNSAVHLTPKGSRILADELATCIRLIGR